MITDSAPKTTFKGIRDSFTREPTLENLLNIVFKIRERGTTIKTEVICGFIHFLSVASCLALNPSQLSHGGYDKLEVATGTAISCCITNILTGVIGNLPFVSHPSLATSIYLSVFMKNHGISVAVGNTIVLFVGLLVTFGTERNLSTALRKIISKDIQIGICVGLSLLIAITALTRLSLVVRGIYDFFVES